VLSYSGFSVFLEPGPEGREGGHMHLEEAAAEFLAHGRIAVAGVSRAHPNAANIIYKRLRTAGYHVFACNPNAEQVEGDVCYHSIKDIGEPLDGVVIATHPDAALAVARECVQCGVTRVWLHRAFGSGSMSSEAVAFCEANGMAVIDGGCPMMFIQPVDVGHRCIRWVLGLTGKLPNGEKYQVPA
jgi:hypothetical protein